MNPRSEHRKTVVIPVKWTEGELVPFYGGELPEIKEGSIVDLTLSVDSLVHVRDADRFAEEKTVLLLPADTQLWARMTKHHYQGPRDRGIPKGFHGNHCYGVEDAFLEPFTILEPLELLLRGTKKGQLKPCRCEVPGFDANTEILSINQAYTRLSERYEPTRKSHSGNVFQRVCFDCDRLILPLHVLRAAKESEAEKELFYRSGELPLEESGR